jgi:hypothetical protein
MWSDSSVCDRLRATEGQGRLRLRRDEYIVSREGQAARRGSERVAVLHAGATSVFLVLSRPHRAEVSTVSSPCEETRSSKEMPSVCTGLEGGPPPRQAAHADV